MSDTTNQVLDVKGLMCPMPLVKARQAVMKMDVGGVLEVQATDKGSIKDFQGWASAAKNVELMEQREEEQDGKTIYVHIVKRTK
jgi:tRNA 2-thiouridine synthesizing protein A